MSYTMCMGMENCPGGWNVRGICPDPGQREHAEIALRGAYRYLDTCTLMAVFIVSEMSYNVSSGTLNTTIP